MKDPVLSKRLLETEELVDGVRYSVDLGTKKVTAYPPDGESYLVQGGDVPEKLRHFLKK